MAVINVASIPGYAEMTAEQKVSALEKYVLPEPDYSGYVKKSVFDATASELASIKKERKEQLSEGEREKQEAAEQLAEMQKTIDALTKDKTVADYKATLLGQGYSEELAASTAQAMADGDAATVFSNQQKFLVEFGQKVKADALKATPTPPSGSGSGTVDYSKQIETARANGNQAEVAYYTRLQAEADGAANKT